LFLTIRVAESFPLARHVTEDVSRIPGSTASRCSRASPPAKAVHTDIRGSRQGRANIVSIAELRDDIDVAFQYCALTDYCGEWSPGAAPVDREIDGEYVRGLQIGVGGDVRERIEVAQVAERVLFKNVVVQVTIRATCPWLYPRDGDPAGYRIELLVHGHEVGQEAVTLEMNVPVRARLVLGDNFGRIAVLNLDLELASLHVGAVVGYGGTHINDPTNCHENARIRRVIRRVDARRFAGAHAGRREDIKPGVLEDARGRFVSILEFAKRRA